MAIAALISPITIIWSEVAIGLLFGIVTTALIFPFGVGFIGRGRGLLLLLAIYLAYVVVILQQ